MARIILKEPDSKIDIKVKENHKTVVDMLRHLKVIDLNFITLQQVEPRKEKAMINPRVFERIEIYEDKETGNGKLIAVVSVDENEVGKKNIEIKEEE